MTMVSLAQARALDHRQQVDEVVAPGRQARVAGMLVLLADRLDEADVLEVAGLLVRRLRQLLEVQLVLEVRPAGRARGVVGVVVERLVVELEQAVRAERVGVGRVGRSGARVGSLQVFGSATAAPVRPAGAARVARGVVPAARVPRPVDAGRGQLVADGDVGRVERRQPPRHGGARRVRLVERLRRVDGVVAAHERGLDRRPASRPGCTTASAAGPSPSCRAARRRAGSCSASRSRRAPSAGRRRAPSFSAPAHGGAAAAISHWWLRYEPPNAPWKKSSAIA